MHSLDIQQRWRTQNLDKWFIGWWMLGFTKSANPNRRADVVKPKT